MILPTIRLVSVLAAAHMWYDSECCGGRDCRPMEPGQIRKLKDGVLVPDFGMLEYRDPRIKSSQDNKDHICVSQTGQLSCVYLRSGDM